MLPGTVSPLWGVEDLYAEIAEIEHVIGMVFCNATSCQEFSCVPLGFPHAPCLPSGCGTFVLGRWPAGPVREDHFFLSFFKTSQVQ